MRKKYIIYIVFTSFLITLVFYAWRYFPSIRDRIYAPTARELYAREFDATNTNYKDWTRAYAKAYNTKHYPIDYNSLFNIPYAAVGTYSPDNMKPYRYLLSLSEGEVLYVTSNTLKDTSRVFIDLFISEKDSIFRPIPIGSNTANTSSLKYEIKVTGTYLLLIQSEIASQSSFETLIYTQPLYTFPVSGKGNKSIQSFWGDSRGGGKRKHKGIDIFAPRGTPLIAATDGIISSTGNRGLGGKQVWLKDRLFGQSLYYAHLDSIIATPGQKVKAGDTLGFVGNTGNAITTPPHLHFGIYKKIGAVNPLAFVEYQEIPEVEDSLKTFLGKIKIRNASVRMLPRAKAQKIAQLKLKDTVILLEKNRNWYRIQRVDTLEGFVYKTAIQPL